MGSINPLAKLEAAAEAIAQTVAPGGYSTSRGEDDSEHAANEIILVGEDLTPEPGLEGVGVWRSTLRVVVKSNAADTTRDAHHSNCQTVFDAFVVDDLASQLTAAGSDFTCQFAYFSAGAREIGGSQSWRTEMTFDVRISSSALVGY